MTRTPPRSTADRVADVRRLLDAARRIHRDRAGLAPEIAEATGLSPEGVELGFESLEQGGTDAELEALVAAAGTARHVHVILSANVFVAPLRAIALARAAAPRVTVRASPRDPAIAREVVSRAGDAQIALVAERDVAAIDADEIHVYGRDETLAAVRSRASAGVLVRGHGAGMGVAIVTTGADVEQAAEAIAGDVAAFDQRGCLSPRVTLVECEPGDPRRAQAVAEALHERLSAWGRRVPRGVLSIDERAEAVRWAGSMAFVGHMWSGQAHAVALAPGEMPLAIGPPGRHVLVVPVATPGEAAAIFRALAPFVVAVGSDDPARARALAPRHARVSALGRMQHPALDGPVDRR